MKRSTGNRDYKEELDEKEVLEQTALTDHMVAEDGWGGQKVDKFMIEGSLSS